MTVLSVNGLSLSFGPKNIFEDVSFALDESDRLGIVGANGCGKSTLLKLLLGEYAPDGGEVYIARDKKVGILTQDDAFTVSEDAGDTALEQMYTAFPELLCAEKRLEELSSWLERHPDESETEKHISITKEFTSLTEEYAAAGGHVFRSKCRSVLEKMGFDGESAELPVTALSGGQRTRLALSRQLCREPDILMLDEPTNHLDIETLGWLENYLAAYPKCIIAVSHDRYFLDRVTNRTLMLDHRRARLYRGGWSASAEQRKTDDEIYERHYRNQQKEIERQEAYIEQQRRWNRERNIIAAESRQKLLDKMEKLDAPEKKERTVSMRFSRGIPSGNDVFIARNIGFHYPGGRQIITGADFIIKRGERIFIVGPNGCGKSTLIKLLLEKLRPTAGVLDCGHNLQVGYYDQENQNLDPDKTVLSELWDAYPGMKEAEVRGVLGTFLFRNDDVFKEINVLSGGERARLTLAKLMLSEMNTLLLDEPTNHLDIGSREALESAINEFDGTLVCVSHDRAFINSLATRILGFDRSGKMHSMPVGHAGHGWDEWQEESAGFAAQAADGAPASRSCVSAQKEDYLRRKKETADARRNAARIQRLKKEQDELESKIDLLNASLGGDAATDYKKVCEITDEINASEERLLEVYGELEELQNNEN